MVRTVVPRPKRPAAHCPVQVEAVRPVVAPKVPQAQKFCVAAVEPAPHQWPALHWPLHVATVMAEVAPKEPAGQFRQAAAEV